MSGIEIFFEKFGIWVGFILYVLWKDVLPVFLNRVVPARIRDRETQRKNAEDALKFQRE